MEKCSDVMQNLSTGDLLELMLTNGYKKLVFFGFLLDNETFIAIDRYMLVTTIGKVEDVESVKLIEKAQDFFESNKQISMIEILKRLMDAKTEFWESNYK